MRGEKQTERDLALQGSHGGHVAASPAHPTVGARRN